MLHIKTLGQGQNLVLLHGWGMNSTVWEGTATALATNFQVTLIDLPGHGFSSWTSAHTQLKDWSQACLDVAPDSALWVGWSLGGAVALNAALISQTKIRALVMMTATPRFLSAEHWPYGLKDEALSRFKAMLKNDLAETLGHFLTLQVHSSAGATTVLRDLKRRLAECPSPKPEALEVGLQLLRGTDLCQSVSTLRVPNLWIYGQRDTLVPWRSSETLRQLLPQAQINIIPKAAHAPFLSHPQVIIELLRQFASVTF